MSSSLPQPYDRRRFGVALAVNAAARPFNLALLLGTMAAAILVGGSVPVALATALILYAAACARTFFDAAEADRVLERVRRDRRAALDDDRARVDAATLAPEIRAQLLAARATEGRIRDAIERADLPYQEVTEEVDALVGLIEQSAARAQLLHEALEETPVSRVQRRLAELRGSGKAELIEALEQQLAVLRRMEVQLQRFHDQMERAIVELETVHGHLVSLSASADAAAQQRLADEVRALRDDMGALASGMRQAFEDGDERTAPAHRRSQ